MGVSENSGTPKSFILIGFSIINPPFLGTPIFGNTQVNPKDNSQSTEVLEIVNHGCRGLRESSPIACAKS